jgi:tRNA (guanine37-N1)-methyltransferase
MGRGRAFPYFIQFAKRIHKYALDAAKLRIIFRIFAVLNPVNMLRIDIISVVPELLESPLSYSIPARAVKKGLAQIHIHDLRKYGLGSRQTVDDYSYGGDAGMVMMVEPVFNCVNDLKKERHYDEVIYMAPDGEILTQGIANELSLKENIIILCGHYKGIDYRIREHLITKEISIGDYVLTGGELAAAVMTDAIVRILPGAIGDEQSALSDSFQDNLLAAPVYTRPAEYKGWRVPDILLSGHEANIKEWELAQSLERTRRLRPDLLDNS